MPTVSSVIKSYTCKPPSTTINSGGDVCLGEPVSYASNRLETMQRSMHSAQRWYEGSSLRTMEEVVYVGVTHTLTRREDAKRSLLAAELVIADWIRIQGEDPVRRASKEYYRGLAFPRDLKKILSPVMRKYIVEWYRSACRKENPSVYWVEILRDALKSVNDHIVSIGLKTPLELQHAMQALNLG